MGAHGGGLQPGITACATGADENCMRNLSRQLKCSGEISAVGLSLVLVAPSFCSSVLGVSSFGLSFVVFGSRVANS